MLRSVLSTAAMAAILLGPLSAMARPTPEQACKAGKNDAAGKYAACLAKAQKSFSITGDADTFARSQGVCSTKLSDAWTKVEAAGGCPSTSDLAAIKNLLDVALTGTASTIQGGETPPVCPSGETCAGPSSFDVLFQLEAGVGVASVQFSVNYSTAPGGFVGTGSLVSCEALVGNLHAFSDTDATSTLLAGFINVATPLGSPPLALARCRFASVGPTPAASDFVITVDDAADLSGGPVPGVVVSVASITVVP